MDRKMIATEIAKPQCGKGLSKTQISEAEEKTSKLAMEKEEKKKVLRVQRAGGALRLQGETTSCAGLLRKDQEASSQHWAVGGKVFPFTGEGLQHFLGVLVLGNQMKSKPSTPLYPTPILVKEKPLEGCKGSFAWILICMFGVFYCWLEVTFCFT